jgi:long-chain fatty acid transport protein
MSPRHIGCLSTIAATAVFTAVAEPASAGAFQLREGSAAAQGMSLAGRSSYARDVSFVLGNPANLRGVEGLEVTGGIAPVLAISEGTLEPSTVPGNRKGEPGTLGFVPSFALGYRLNRQFVLGLTMDSPFGLVTSYDSDWAGAPDGLDSELLTVAVTPMLSFQPIPELALAGGVTLQYSDARLSNTTAPGNEADIEGDDFGVGFILGAAWDPLPGTSLGIRFRSGMDVGLEGRFSDNYIIPGVGSFAGPGRADFSLPASVNFGATQALGDDWRIMTEIEFTDWSVYDRIVITSDNGPFPLIDEQQYEDSWTVALGAEYDYSARLTLRGGLAFDETPTVDAFRTTRVPDGDRVWFSAGFSWEVTERFGVDAAYTYILFPDDPTVTLRQVPGATATYSGEVHVLGINGRYRF